ncbi:MAG: carboxypeptidase regulatory-like domain-containing protein, partial [Planctomycetaceae bacterium]|nr:carboxypeptidase regulatory-like domain-containing protein [Planctomycetaceae bacterium]
MTFVRLGKFPAILACVAAAISVTAQAAEKVVPAKSGVVDVALQADGTLLGRMVSSEGRAIDGAVVTLATKDGVIGRTTTDAEGVYRFANQTPGAYRISAGQQVQEFRVWPEEAAPPGAQAYALIVDSNRVIRAQMSTGGLGTVVGV